MKKNKKKNFLRTQITYLTIALAASLCIVTNAFCANQMSADTYSFTVIEDSNAPYVEGCVPQANSKKVSFDTNVKFVIKDDISGIDSSTIDLTVDGDDVVIDGVIQTYTDQSGATVEYKVEIVEKNTGEYVILYDSVEYFKYRQNVEIILNVNDVAGNLLSGYTYSFKIQNMIFGRTKKFFNVQAALEQSAVEVIQDNSCIAVTNGRGKKVYIAWEERSSDGDWDIYFVKSSDFGQTFTNAVKVNRNEENVEHRNPAIAVDSAKNVYVVWQQRSLQADWDLYIARLDNGNTEYGDSYLIYDDLGVNNQTHPAIDVGAALTDDGIDQTEEPPTIHISWLDANFGGTTAINYIRTTADYTDQWYEFVNTAIRIDDDRAIQNHATPAIKLDSNGDIFVAWRENTDGTNSIYFDNADSTDIDNGESFGSDVVVSDATAGDDKVALSVSPNGRNVYLGWKEINGLQANVNFAKYSYNQQQGKFLLDTQSEINTSALASESLGAYSMKADNAGDAFVVWSEQSAGDWDIHLGGASHLDYSFENYMQFDEDTAQATQSNPCLAIGTGGHHYYISWTDETNGVKEINFIRNTFIDTDEINSAEIEQDIGGNVTVTSGDLAGTKVEVMEDALEAPVQVTVTEVIAPPDISGDVLRVGNVVDFGPGGTLFSKPATIKIPYADVNLTSGGVVIEESSLKIYYYNLETLAWEQVSGATVDVIANTVSVATSHFSIYMIGGVVQEEDAGDGGDTGGDTGGNPGGSGSGGGGGGGCFIATAAFGTKMAKEVRILCEFRDQFLMTNSWGKKFVKIYYTYSPPIADYISQQEGLKEIIRICLKPLIAMSKLLCR